MLDQSKVPGLRALALSLGDVLPADHSDGEPRYLSISALEICIARKWGNHSELIARGLACAQEYWSGRGSEDELKRLRIALFDQYRLEQARSGKDSKKASRYAMVVWSLDADTPSSSYAADYLLDAAIRAGVSLDDLRSVLERNIPGLSAAIAQRGGL